jgi:head-tail adaptor
MPVASGQMRHRLTLYAPQGTRGDGTAANLLTGIPARIEAVPLQFQQQERLAAGGIQAQTLYNIQVRYHEDIAKDLELHEECCTQRTFQIVSMIPSDKLDWLDLTCLTAG